MGFDKHINYVELEYIRQKYYKQYRKIRTLGYIILISALLLFIVEMFMRVAIFGIIGSVFLLVGIVVLALAAGKHYALVAKLKEVIFTEIIKQMYGVDALYFPFSHIKVERMLKTGLFAEPDKVRGNDFISGEYKGVSFVTSDIHLIEEEEDEDSDGDTYDVTIFEGRYFIFNLGRSFDEVISITERPISNIRSFWKEGKIISVKKVETESIVFNKKFSIRASDPAFFYYIMTPAFMEDLLELEASLGGGLIFYLYKDELHLGLYTIKPTLNLRLSRRITYETIKSLLPSLEIIAKIIDDLNLSSNKFNHPKGGI